MVHESTTATPATKKSALNVQTQNRLHHTWLMEKGGGLGPKGSCPKCVPIKYSLLYMSRNVPFRRGGGGAPMAAA